MAELEERREEEPQEVPSAERDLASPKIRRAYANITSALTDEEFRSPGVSKMMLAEIERLAEENFTLKTYLEKYYEADKKVSVLNESQYKIP